MEPGHWYRISGDRPDLGLPATAVGACYLKDNDPAHDPALIPPTTPIERLRRLAGRDWIAPSGDDGGGNAFVACCPDGLNPDGTFGGWREFHPNKLPGEANHNAMQIHPESDLILVAPHGRDTLAVVDPAHPADPIAPVASLGSKPRIHDYAALEYSAGTGSLVYYSAADGSVVYGIDWDGKARWHALSEPGLDCRRRHPVSSSRQSRAYVRPISDCLLRGK